MMGNPLDGLVEFIFGAVVVAFLLGAAAMFGFQSCAQSCSYRVQVVHLDGGPR